MKILACLSLILSTLGLTLLVIAAPDFFEFGGYLQRGFVHTGTIGCTLAAAFSIRTLTHP